MARPAGRSEAPPLMSGAGNDPLRKARRAGQAPIGAGKGTAVDIGHGPGSDPTSTMGWVEILGSWYRGEEIDAEEARALWLRTGVALAGIWILSYLRPT